MPHTRPEPDPSRSRPLDLVRDEFVEDPHLDTAVAAALMRQVARGELCPTVRIHRTGPILAFGRLDRLRPGYRRAVEIARELGFVPIERLAGGRAAVFHEGTISFSQAVRAEPPTSAYSGTRDRFEAMAGVIAEALTAVGVDAEVGEVAGEYCPGEFSISAGGRRKLAGVGQRVIAGGAHVGGVIVVRGADRIRQALEPVYAALELDWRPETTGSVAMETGAGEATMPAAEPDPLIEQVTESLISTLARNQTLEPANLHPSTLSLARSLVDDHRPTP